MTLSRRRFLTISAAALAAPMPTFAASWTGVAFGADVSLTIRAPREEAEAALSRARRIIEDVEGLFSLYRENSDLVRLNRTGLLRDPDPRFFAVVQAADRAHVLTEGRFDPTIQPYWLALSRGDDPAEAARALGWGRVGFDANVVTLGAGQALTFNGIAQGYATDLVADALGAMGLSDILVNIGEYRASGGPWRLGISDPERGIMGFQTLSAGAVATSSPGAMSLGAESHVLHPDFRPLWSTVSVTATTATLSDSLSTALCLAPRDLIEAVAGLPEVMMIRMVDFVGDLTTIRA